MGTLIGSGLFPFHQTVLQLLQDQETQQFVCGTFGQESAITSLEDTIVMLPLLASPLQTPSSSYLHQLMVLYTSGMLRATKLGLHTLAMGLLSLWMVPSSSHGIRRLPQSEMLVLEQL